jgi:hypothetical protein
LVHAVPQRFGVRPEHTSGAGVGEGLGLGEGVGLGLGEGVGLSVGVKVTVAVAVAVAIRVGVAVMVAVAVAVAVEVGVAVTVAVAVAVGVAVTVGVAFFCAAFPFRWTVASCFPLVALLVMLMVPSSVLFPVGINSTSTVRLPLPGIVLGMLVVIL